MAKPTTLDLLMAHAPITVVLFEVVDQVRKAAKLSAALDASLDSDSVADNMRARFLARRRAYEITLIFDAKPWKLPETEGDEA